MTDIEKLYLKEKVKMPHSCYWKGISKEDIEDAIDESFTKIFEQLGENADVEQFRELWWREFNNQISKCRYEKKRYKTAKERLNTDDEIETNENPEESYVEQGGKFSKKHEVIEKDDTFEDAAEREFEDELFMEALEPLPPHLAETMFLKYIEHYTNAEIAKELCITENVVQKYLSQGLKQVDRDKLFYGKRRIRSKNGDKN